MAYHPEEQAVDYYVYDPNKRLVGVKMPLVYTMITGKRISIGGRGWLTKNVLALDPNEELVLDPSGASHSLQGMVVVQAGDLQKLIKNWRPVQTSIFTAPKEQHGQA